MRHICASCITHLIMRTLGQLSDWIPHRDQIANDITRELIGSRYLSTGWFVNHLEDGMKKSNSLRYFLVGLCLQRTHKKIWVLRIIVSL